MAVDLHATYVAVCVQENKRLCNARAMPGTLGVSVALRSFFKGQKSCSM